MARRALVSEYSAENVHKQIPMFLYSGQYFDKHLKRIVLNTQPAPFTLMNLTYLQKEEYDKRFAEEVRWKVDKKKSESKQNTLLGVKMPSDHTKRAARRWNVVWWAGTVCSAANLFQQGNFQKHCESVWPYGQHSCMCAHSKPFQQYCPAARWRAAHGISWCRPVYALGYSSIPNAAVKLDRLWAKMGRWEILKRNVSMHSLRKTKRTWLLWAYWIKFVPCLCISTKAARETDHYNLLQTWCSKSRESKERKLRQRSSSLWFSTAKTNN